MTYQITDRPLEAGDTVELGDVEDSHTEVSSGGLHLIAAWKGEATEYVVLRFHAADGEEVESDGQVLAVEQGSGMANPSVWMLIPVGEYE
jgi:hypothetical protein